MTQGEIVMRIKADTFVAFFVVLVMVVGLVAAQLSNPESATLKTIATPIVIGLAIAGGWLAFKLRHGE